MAVREFVESTPRRIASLPEGKPKRKRNDSDSPVLPNLTGKKVTIMIHNGKMSSKQNDDGKAASTSSKSSDAEATARPTFGPEQCLNISSDDDMDNSKN